MILEMLIAMGLGGAIKKWKARQVKSVFKVFTKSQWDEFNEKGRFAGAPLDLDDGYIHLSTAIQVDRVVKKYFAGEEVVYIGEFADPELIKGLVWEQASNKDIFPHLYGASLQLSGMSSFKEILLSSLL